MLITMSEKDIYRFEVLSNVREKRLRQVDAAVILRNSKSRTRCSWSSKLPTLL